MQASRYSYLVRLILAAGVLGLLSTGCVMEETSGFRSALTGEECIPDETYVARDTGNGNSSPTGIPGDNLDDERSGKIDCLYDGNSGQGDDTESCEFPPGCDEQGCCDEEIVPEEPIEEPEGDEPVDEGDDPVVL